MHLTVTQWRSLVPMAQKSEVSEIAGSVPLETGKKLNTPAVCVQMHISPSSISILYDTVMLLQHYFPRFTQHMNTRKT